MKVELKTVMGQVQKYNSEAELLEDKNKNGRFYAIRDGANGRELWHKGHNTMAGVIERVEE